MSGEGSLELIEHLGCAVHEQACLSVDGSSFRESASGVRDDAHAPTENTAPGMGRPITSRTNVDTLIRCSLEVGGGVCRRGIDADQIPGKCPRARTA